jgi:hypothetical protein
MNEKRLKAMLKYLPCRAGAIPQNLRQLGLAEREGLVVYNDRTFVWTLTPKGVAFVDGSLKAPAARRFA